MKLKEISKDIFDVDAMLNEELGYPGISKREQNVEKA